MYWPTLNSVAGTAATGSTADEHGQLAGVGYMPMQRGPTWLEQRPVLREVQCQHEALEEEAIGGDKVGGSQPVWGFRQQVQQHCAWDHQAADVEEEVQRRGVPWVIQCRLDAALYQVRHPKYVLLPPGSSVQEGKGCCCLGHGAAKWKWVQPTYSCVPKPGCSQHQTILCTVCQRNDNRICITTMCVRCVYKMVVNVKLQMALSRRLKANPHIANTRQLAITGGRANFLARWVHVAQKALNA
jgi:hypothetical protein